MNYELFEPLVMFFSMTNSPTIFQTIINDIYWYLIVEEIMVVYLDNIFIFTQILEEHHRVVYKVLDKHKLFLHLEKCKLNRQQIEYLDLVISEDQVEIYSMNVAGVCNWPVLQNYTELQAFLSFTNFYQQFTHGFSTIACSLFNLTRNNSI